MRFPAFIGDIGGTFARFAIVEEKGKPFRLLARQETADHADPVAAIRAALDGAGSRPRSALLAVAGRISGQSVRLTNARWTIDAGEVGRGLGLESVMVMNDYAATAASLAALDERRTDHLLRIGHGHAGGAPGSRVVLGPGTGLGAAALVDLDGRLAIQTTEAGHVDFGARGEEECRLWALMREGQDRLSAEDLLSGRGLERLYRGLARSRREAPSLDSPARIVAAGLEAGGSVAGEALALFARLLGRFSGDLALLFGANGGVFVAGGIAQRIAAILEQGGFRAEFERKHPFEDAMTRIPTFLVTHPEPALEGLSALAADPDRFLLHAVRWRRSSPRQ
jgi:glucokinase